MPKTWTALLAMLAACVPSPYRPGKLTETIDGEAYPNATRAGECLDVAAWWLPSLEVRPRQLVVIAFGNRCDHATPIAPSRISVEAIYGDLRVAQLSPFDPKGELYERRLAPHERGNERIAFFADPTPRELCLAFPGGERRICITRSPE